MEKLLGILFLALVLIVTTAGYSQDKATNEWVAVEGIKQPKKGTVLALTVLLGPIGGHRVLLGTKPIIPILYAITLGGGFGLVPLIDFIACILKKDTTDYEKNERFLMWLKDPNKD